MRLPEERKRKKEKERIERFHFPTGVTSHLEFLNIFF